MADDEPELELDPTWAADRAAKIAAAAAAMNQPPRKSPRKGGALVVALLLVGLVAAAVVVMLRHEPVRPAPTSKSRATSVISISIRAVGAVDVMIDGRFAGRTPLVLNWRRGTKPVLVEARQLGAVHQIVPDRDQTLFLERQ